ncbi:hypothetical protein FKM82_008848 [Ascaphus truei]
MIVERVIEDSLELLDQGTMSSPMNLGYFYGLSPGSCSGSETGSSPAHSSSSMGGSCGFSGPCSPASDTEPAGSLSASWPGAGHLVGIGRQQKGTFQGVRVKNPVKELLQQIRKSKPGSFDSDEFQQIQSGMNCDQYAELSKILKSNRKRTHDFILEGPAGKKQYSFQATSFLTPPSTPNSSDNMDDVPKSDIRMDSNLDMLQSIINIKNESNPVSLNTVKVSWMNRFPQNENSEEQYQEVPMAYTYSPPEASQPFNECSPPQINEQYQFSSLHPQHVPAHFNAMYSHFSDNSQSPNYQTAVFPQQDLQNCSMQSYVSLSDPEASSEIMPVKPAAEASAPAQNFSLTMNTTCSAFSDHHMMQTTPSVSPQLCITERSSSSPLQMGKSFFQWQIEQEEKKIANISQEQLLSKDADGDTYLHISVAQGRRALSYVFAREMAALNMLDVKEHNNQSAFQVAVAANQHLIVLDLISLGAQVTTTDSWGRTPLHVCAVKGYSQVLQAIQKGVIASNQYVDVEATNYEGLTALHCAVIAHNAVVQQLQKNRPLRSPETEELLLKNKAMVETVKMLLQMGASVEARDRKSGRTALHLASEEANLELLRLFLELPNCLSFINAKAYNGNAVLHVAASLQYRITQLDAVRLLMRKGADPSARNLENEQPVHLVADGPVGEQVMSKTCRSLHVF